MGRLSLQAMKEALTALERRFSRGPDAETLLRGLQIVEAAEIAARRHPVVEPTLPLLLPAVTAMAAAQVETTLLNVYPNGYPVTCIPVSRSATEPSAEPQVEERALGTFTASPWPVNGAHLYLAPLPHAESVGDLQELVAHLRAPDGCPWDRAQTLASLRQDLLGEAVEVLEAIDVEQDGSDNSEHIAEELGDLMLLITMMVQIATDEGRFKMPDVTRHVVHKLIRRHPHVFGEADVDGIEEIYTNWDAIKAQEKAAKGIAPAGPLDGVPPHLPALEKARKLQSKAEKAGLLERRALADAAPGLRELLGPHPDSARLGTVLWHLVALAHEADLNAEDALRAAAVRYRQSVTENGRSAAPVVD